MDHPRLDELWLDFVEGNLANEEAQVLRTHLDACRECASRYEELAAVHRVSRAVGRQVAERYKEVGAVTFPRALFEELLPEFRMVAGMERIVLRGPLRTLSGPVKVRESRSPFWFAIIGAAALAGVVMLVLYLAGWRP